VPGISAPILLDSSGSLHSYYFTVELKTPAMENGDKEQDNDGVDIQGLYSTVITDFRTGLLRWLEQEPDFTRVEDHEDRQVDALLLKVLTSSHVI